MERIKRNYNNELDWDFSYRFIKLKKNKQHVTNTADFTVLNAQRSADLNRHQEATTFCALSAQI